MAKSLHWDSAKQRQLVRVDSVSGQEVPLERGVNFFVEALESIGARTLFSCEGHPHGFYVVFEASEAIARCVSSCGFFTVEMINRPHCWAIRLSRTEHHHPIETGRPWTERDKRQVLRWAADAWHSQLGVGRLE